MHAASHVAAHGRALVDRVAVTKALTAVAPDHPELAAAHESGIAATSVQQLIADAAVTRGQVLVGVAGTHGKSTTTGWVVHLLTVAGLDPSAFVGALLPAAVAGGVRPSTVRVGSGRHFVVEADEYAGNFDAYRPVIGALTNADWDHPDVFADRGEVVAAFVEWIRRFDGKGEPPILVANAGDPGVREVLPSLTGWPGRLLLVDVVAEEADPRAALAGLSDRHGTGAGPAAALVGRWRHAAGEGSLGMVGFGLAHEVTAVLPIPGRHNAENGLVAAGVAYAAGATPSAIAAGISTFEGVGRRLELAGDVAGVVVLDDYGHHPTAMMATFAAVRERYAGRRLWAVYEPLTYHRTAAMLDAFAAILEQADRVVVADIHAGRDPDTTITSAAALAEAVARRGRTPAWAPGTVEETADWLAGRVGSGRRRAGDGGRAQLRGRGAPGDRPSGASAALNEAAPARLPPTSSSGDRFDESRRAGWLGGFRFAARVG